MRTKYLLYALGAALLTVGGSPKPRSAQAQTVTGAPIRCLEVADERTLMTENDAERLCAGTRSDVGPVECYRYGSDHTTLSNVRLVRLCRCALGTRPIRCYEHADDATDLLEHEIVRSCRAIHARELKPDCSPVD